MGRLDLPGALDAVAAWQLKVHQHDIGDMTGYLLERVVDCPRRAQAFQVRLGCDRDLERGRECLLILHYQDCRHLLPLTSPVPPRHIPS